MSAGAIRANSILPWKWLRSLAGQIYNEFFEDSIPTVAGGVTFFALLALFPALACVVTLYRLTADAGTIHRELDILSGFLPGGAVTILGDELHRLTAQKATGLSPTFFAGLGIALWSASGGFKALVEAFNVAYEVKEKRGFVRLTMNALLFTAVAILFALVAINLGLILPAWVTGSDAPVAIRILVQVVAWPLSFLAGTVLLALVYRFGPDRVQAKWRWITWGSAIASLLWLLGTVVFTWYVGHYGSYNRVYGNLGALIGFLTWIWLSIVVLLLGAEIDCALERQDSG